jgi:predicted ATP-dependent endonuclease of OLD family
MRVKRLDLFGFKSFAAKTTVHFERGVTAIVGPNGSGKSNLVDAIRWVLGEHNPRDVRAPRLEDVIFNGTDTNAPLSMADVTLTIDNEQALIPIAFSEVQITRRVYRSGESECFLNQSPCRLRDIQELSYQEIADRLRLPEGTVKSRINRGRTELTARILRIREQRDRSPAERSRPGRSPTPRRVRSGVTK